MRFSKFITLTSLVLSGLLISPNAEAKLFQCKGGKIVRTGDTMADVVHKCGQPIFKQNNTIELTSDRAVATVQWTYKPRQKYGFLKHLHFKGGKLVAIENGARAN